MPQASVRMSLKGQMTFSHGRIRQEQQQEQVQIPIENCSPSKTIPLGLG